MATLPELRISRLGEVTWAQRRGLNIRNALALRKHYLKHPDTLWNELDVQANVAKDLGDEAYSRFFENLSPQTIAYAVFSLVHKIHAETDEAKQQELAALMEKILGAVQLDVKREQRLLKEKKLKKLTDWEKLIYKPLQKAIEGDLPKPYNMLIAAMPGMAKWFAEVFSISEPITKTYAVGRGLNKTVTMRLVPIYPHQINSENVVAFAKALSAAYAVCEDDKIKEALRSRLGEVMDAFCAVSRAKNHINLEALLQIYRVAKEHDKSADLRTCIADFVLRNAHQLGKSGTTDNLEEVIFEVCVTETAETVRAQWPVSYTPEGKAAYVPEAIKKTINWLLAKGRHKDAAKMCGNIREPKLLQTAYSDRAKELIKGYKSAELVAIAAARPEQVDTIIAAALGCLAEARAKAKAKEDSSLLPAYVEAVKNNPDLLRAVTEHPDIFEPCIKDLLKFEGYAKGCPQFQEQLARFETARKLITALSDAPEIRKVLMGEIYGKTSAIFDEHANSQTPGVPLLVEAFERIFAECPVGARIFVFPESDRMTFPQSDGPRLIAITRGLIRENEPQLALDVIMRNVLPATAIEPNKDALRAVNKGNVWRALAEKTPVEFGVAINQWFDNLSSFTASFDDTQKEDWRDLIDEARKQVREGSEKTHKEASARAAYAALRKGALRVRVNGSLLLPERSLELVPEEQQKERARGIEEMALVPPPSPTDGAIQTEPAAAPAGETYVMEPPASVVSPSDGDGQLHRRDRALTS